jgi:hypothetical protein
LAINQWDMNNMTLEGPVMKMTTGMMTNGDSGSISYSNAVIVPC